METSVTSVSAMEAQQARMPRQKEHGSFITGWLGKEKAAFSSLLPYHRESPGQTICYNAPVLLSAKGFISRHKRNAFFLV